MVAHPALPIRASPPILLGTALAVLASVTGARDLLIRDTDAEPAVPYFGAIHGVDFALPEGRPSATPTAS